MKTATIIILAFTFCLSFGFSYIVKQTVVSNNFFKQKDINSMRVKWYQDYASGMLVTYHRDSTRQAILTGSLISHIVPEAKDVSKSFITVVVAVLVASITFAEKIVGYRDARTWPKAWMTAAWITFLLSLLFCGIGMAYLMMTEGYALNFSGMDQAINPGAFANPFEKPAYLDSLYTCSFWFSAAGFLFCFGLIDLIITASISINSANAIQSKTQG